MQDAARNNRLSSDSYKRLGAAGFVCFYLLCWCAWSDLGVFTPLGLVAQRCAPNAPADPSRACLRLWHVQLQQYLCLPC